MKKIKSIVFAFLVILCGSIYSFAQDGEDPDAAAKPEYRQELGRVIAIKEDELPYELDSYLRYMPSSGANCQSGKLAITEGASEFSYDAKLFGELPVELALGTRYIGINNTTAVELPSRLTQISTGVETILPFFFDKTYLTVGVAPSIYSYNWKVSSSSFRIPQRYFLIHQPNDKLTLVCGIQVFPDSEDVVSPILGFIYKPNDKLSFNITPSQPEIAYSFNDRWSVLLQADMSDDEFEVKKDNMKNVVLEYNEMHLGTGVRYQPNKYIQSSLSAGYIFNRSIEYDDDNLGKVSIRDGIYTELRIDISV
jgi:hypothetical protein